LRYENFQHGDATPAQLHVAFKNSLQTGLTPFYDLSLLKKAIPIAQNI
jgi:hypothetical protein